MLLSPSRYNQSRLCVFCLCLCSIASLFARVACCSHFSQAAVLDQEGYLEPEDENFPYYPLRDDPVESATRASYWHEQESIKYMWICKITFTAVGVATLFPSGLTVQPGTEHTRYRLICRLYRSFKSSHDEPLYSISDESMKAQ